jgi:O-antigen ligase
MASRSLPLAGPARQASASATTLGISIGALLAACAFATAAAYSAKTGAVILLGACFVPLALWRLPLAICAWTALVFLSSAATIGAYPNRILLFVGLAWLGLLAGRRTSVRGAIAESPLFVALVALFVAWMLLSLAWAPVPGAIGTSLKQLLYAGFSILLLLGAMVERRRVRWLAAAFVAGATASVLWGAAKGGLAMTSGAASEVADSAGRFQGGAGDPNYLAAVLVPAIMLAGGLAVRKAPSQRVLLALATIIISIGLAATQSRGGLLAASVCALVALVIWRERRALIAGLIALAAAATASYFLLKPSAWSRILESNQGSGRIDIWTVAWRIVHAHPYVGVGFGQFPEVSSHYVLQPGALQYIGLIVENQIVVHNLYLALWVEGGIVGLLLFLGVVGVSLASGWRASKRFDALGDIEMSSLARASVLALVGILAASFFLSDIVNAELWILLALGPVLAALAERQARAAVLSLAPG